MDRLGPIPLSLPARPTWTGPTFPRPGPSHGPALKFTRPDPALLLSLPAWPTRALPGPISTCGSYFPARRRTHPLAQPPGPGLDPPASHTRPLCPHHASRVLRCRCAPAFWPVSPLTRVNKATAGHPRRQNRFDLGWWQPVLARALGSDFRARLAWRVYKDLCVSLSSNARAA